VALLEEATGAAVEVPDDLFAAPERPSAGTTHAADAGPRYEVMFLLEAAEPAGERLREAWRELGSSIVVVGGGREWNCHIHTDDIGAAIEAGISLGRPHRIVIADLYEQSAAAAFHDSGFEPLPTFADQAVGVVAVGTGEGIAALFRDAGAQGMVAGGQTMNPSVGAMLEVVESVPASTVIVLPNNKNVIPAAEELDALSAKRVEVVPTRSLTQGLAALLAYQPGVDPGRTLAAMNDAAAGCRSGELTRAVRSARTPLGAVAEGDWLGSVDGEMRIIAADETEAVLALLDAIVDDDTEMVTLITGRDASPGGIAAAEGWMAAHCRGVEVEVHRGDQPIHPYLLGAE
jgi:dihydroxyacetone kinase-like predicted kinase